MIALITMTGARKGQFEMCKQWMDQQTYTGDVVWVVVDDAIPITIDDGYPYRSDWTIVKTYPRPAWNGNNTQARNIKAGIDYIKRHYRKHEIEAIFIIEDDDYYKPNYLEVMMNRIDDNWLIGETNTIYYNVHWRRYMINANRHHASLFQTAFTWDAIPILESKYGDKFIDVRLWKHCPYKHLFFDNYLSLGMKGMPGRGGIGAGHSRAMSMKADISMIYLRKHIGDHVKLYKEYYGDSCESQHPRFTTKSL